MPVTWRISEGCVLLESDEGATIEEWKTAVEDDPSEAMAWAKGKEARGSNVA